MTDDPNVLAELRAIIRREEPIIRAPDFERSQRYFLLDEEGSYEEYVGIPPGVRLRLGSAEAVADVAIEASDNGWSVAILWGEEQIEVVEYPDEQSPIIHRLELDEHPVAKTVGRLCESRSFTQPKLVRFLRSELTGYVPESVVDIFRTVRFTGAQDSNRLVGKFDASLDRKIVEAMTDRNGAEFPDEILVDVPALDLPEPSTHPVRLIVDGSSDEGKAVFTLTAVHSDLREARTEAARLLAEEIRIRLDDRAKGPGPIRIVHANALATR